jgi:P27 family predicted phage terminase small subunit
MRPGPKPRRLTAGAYDTNKAKEILSNDSKKAPTGGIPSCPNFVDPAAKSEWRRVVIELSKVHGLLAAVDRSCLTEYCVCWAHFKDAERHLLNEGMIQTVTDAHGNGIRTQQSPWVAIELGFLASLRKASDRLGFSPAARTDLRLFQLDTTPKLGSNVSGPLTPPRSLPPRRLPDPEPVIEAVLTIEVPSIEPSGREPDIEPDQRAADTSDIPDQRAADVPEQDTSPDQWIEGRRQTG